MSMEYPVKIKFTYDNSELKNVSDKASVAVKGGSTSEGDGKETKGTMMGMLGKLGIIAGLLSALNQLVAPLLQAVQILVFIGIAMIVKAIVSIVKAIGSIFTADFWKGIGEALVNFAKNLWDGIVAALQPILQFGVWLWDTLIKPAFEFLKDVGLWIWDTIIKPAFMFLVNAGLWIWDTIIKPAFNFLIDAGLWIWEQIIMPAFMFLINVGLWIWEQIIRPSFMYLAGVGLWLWEQIILPAWMFLKDVGSWIWDQILKPAWEFLLDIGTWIWEIVKSPFQWLADKIRTIWGWFTGSSSKDSGSSSSRDGTYNGDKVQVKDPNTGKWKQAGSKAFGGTIGETGLYMLHAGESISRGNTTTVNKSPTIIINVQGGSTDNDLVNKIARAVNNQMRAYSRG